MTPGVMVYYFIEGFFIGLGLVVGVGVAFVMWAALSAFVGLLSRAKQGVGLDKWT